MTSLIQHERISTTYAKAKEAQRVAEKVITKAKKSIFNNQNQQHVSARDYVYSRNETVPRLEELARRFEKRPGGYTRLHLHGNRIGDNAPRALLEFVDTPDGDLKLEMTAMAMGREAYIWATKSGPSAIEQEIATIGTRPIEEDDRLNHVTRLNADKVLKHRGDEGRTLLRSKARDHFYKLMATEQLEGPRRPDEERWEKEASEFTRGESKLRTKPMTGEKRLAGMRRDYIPQGPPEPNPSRIGRKNSVIRIGKGAFARRQNSRVRFTVPPPRIDPVRQAILAER